MESYLWRLKLRHGFSLKFPGYFKECVARVGATSLGPEPPSYHLFLSTLCLAQNYFLLWIPKALRFFPTEAPVHILLTLRDWWDFLLSVQRDLETPYKLSLVARGAVFLPFSFSSLNICPHLAPQSMYRVATSEWPGSFVEIPQPPVPDSAF